MARAEHQQVDDLTQCLAFSSTALAVCPPVGRRDRSYWVILTSECHRRRGGRFALFHPQRVENTPSTVVFLLCITQRFGQVFTFNFPISVKCTIIVTRPALAVGPKNTLKLQATYYHVAQERMKLTSPSEISSCFSSLQKVLKSFDISKTLSHFSNKLVTLSQSIMNLVKLRIRQLQFR